MQNLNKITLVVRDYDEAIAFFTQTLGFDLTEDTRLTPVKRWVVVTPPGSACGLLLARAATDEQLLTVCRQTAGRVAFFLHTDDIRRDVATYRSRGVEFVRDISEESYGTVAVFRDLYGNLWDLIEPRLEPSTTHA